MGTCLLISQAYEFLSRIVLVLHELLSIYSYYDAQPMAEMGLTIERSGTHEASSQFIGTTESVHKKRVQLRIGLVNQHGDRFIVLEHQYGCRDVM